MLNLHLSFSLTAMALTKGLASTVDFSFEYTDIGLYEAGPLSFMGMIIVPSGSDVIDEVAGKICKSFIIEIILF